MSFRGRGRGRGGGAGGRSGYTNNPSGGAVVDYGQMEGGSGPIMIVNRSRADEDVSMGGVAGGRGRGRTNPYGVGQRRFPNRTLTAGNGGGALSNEVSITGWDERNKDPVSLFNFISGKAETQVNVVSHRIEGKELVIKYRNPLEVAAVVKLSGIKYAGGKLFIKSLNAPVNAGPSDTIANKPEVVDLLREILTSLYRQDDKLLNLANLAAHPGMQQNASLSGFGSDAVETNKIGPVICKLIKELFPDVQSINLQSNRLSTVKPFETLYIYCPFIQNLSFQDNLIQAYRELESLRGDKLKNLHELLLLGNPVHDREARKGEEGITAYRTKIKQMFPSLKMLDTVPFAEEVALPEIGLPSVDELPQTIKGSFVENQPIADLMQEFIPKFFALFDTNRPALADVYTSDAIFSMSVNSTSRSAPKGPGKGTRREFFDSWFTLNRNHLSTKDAGKRVALMAKTPQSIQSTFMKLPQTKHPINASFEKAMFAVDAFQQAIGDAHVLILTVNGEFHEVIPNKTRCFTRTLVLVPAPEGSMASQAGWKVCIANDMLVVRSWTHDRVWEGKPVAGAGPTSGPLVGLAHGAKPFDLNPKKIALPSDLNMLMAFKTHYKMDDNQHNQIISLAQATGLNYQTAGQCLESAQWNGQAALETFHNVRANIPPESFVFVPI
ncbi:hypothetical protein BC830DRAFT_1112449 [Chytriomyces sp. MP71]|nr:hypothetical protein BC830DRAFT_1112449 [Chytriomyces sp. MP71]